MPRLVGRAGVEPASIPYKENALTIELTARNKVEGLGSQLFPASENSTGHPG
jgi:hypothetical protein